MPHGTFTTTAAVTAGTIYLEAFTPLIRVEMAGLYNGDDLGEAYGNVTGIGTAEINSTNAVNVKRGADNAVAPSPAVSFVDDPAASDVSPEDSGVSAGNFTLTLVAAGPYVKHIKITDTAYESGSAKVLVLTFTNVVLQAGSVQLAIPSFRVGVKTARSS
jgi:hypothetical protein